jgi:hypothetical protein
LKSTVTAKQMSVKTKTSGRVAFAQFGAMP